MMANPGSPEMEVVVVWDGEMFKHMPPTSGTQNPGSNSTLNKPGCKARVWYRLAGAQRLH